MSEFTNPEYLLTNQYKNAANLNARIQLHLRFSTNKYDLEMRTLMLLSQTICSTMYLIGQRH
jgi:hypothetical protein